MGSRVELSWRVLRGGLARLDGVGLGLIMIGVTVLRCAVSCSVVLLRAVVVCYAVLCCAELS